MLTFEGTHRSGINTGAIRLQIYNNIHTQLDTTRIHIATSDLPMYTSSSGLPTTALTTFLNHKGQGNSVRRNQCTHQSVSNIATYIAPSTKMMWNQEYFELVSKTVVKRRQ